MSDLATAKEFFPLDADAEVALKVYRSFRRKVADNVRARNIMDGGQYTFEDAEVFGFIEDAINDINSGVPITNYTLSTLGDIAFIADGAVIQALLSRGMLETKNAIQYNDSGVSINTYDKGPSYQAWAGTYSQNYYNRLANLKLAEIYRNPFVGIESNPW